VTTIPGTENPASRGERPGAIALGPEGQNDAAPQRSLGVTRVTLPLRWGRLIHTNPAGTYEGDSMLELP